MLSKLTKWHILGIGVGVALVLGIVLYFALINPMRNRINDTNSQIASVEQNGGTQEQVEQEKRLLETTQKQALQAQESWQINQARYMPALPFHKNDNSSDLIAIYALRGFDKIPQEWGRWLQHWYDAQMNDGITLLTVFQIPAFPTDPNAIANYSKGITLPEQGKSWTVTVMCKSFQAAMNHLKRINTDLLGHGMPVVDNVSLKGQSPALMLTYSLTLYIIPNNPPPPPDARLQVTSGQNAAGGMGMMGEMPYGMGMSMYSGAAMGGMGGPKAGRPMPPTPSGGAGGTSAGAAE
ncbi:hypothetical protein CWRG_02769 [Chthonomonas calidirosea]|uniref:hypothetical protein n=1 Tax=Chthonomonas calidirosea TaxID=454171 RepID=UPI0006DD45AB|nr:hypothetical protein [Chthonomonas calidirosea]CEK20243.1 hypothetical protein CWRG_02769 [Chthonomonas calidirosea]